MTPFRNKFALVGSAGLAAVLVFVPISATATTTIVDDSVGNSVKVGFSLKYWYQKPPRTDIGFLAKMGDAIDWLLFPKKFYSDWPSYSYTLSTIQSACNDDSLYGAEFGSVALVHATTDNEYIGFPLNSESIYTETPYDSYRKAWISVSDSWNKKYADIGKESINEFRADEMDKFVEELKNSGIDQGRLPNDVGKWVDSYKTVMEKTEQISTPEWVGEYHNRLGSQNQGDAWINAFKKDIELKWNYGMTQSPNLGNIAIERRKLPLEHDPISFGETCLFLRSHTKGRNLVDVGGLGDWFVVIDKPVTTIPFKERLKLYGVSYGK